MTVIQADPYRQLLADEDLRPIADAVAEASTSALTYEPIAGDPIDERFEIDRPVVCHVGPDAGWPTLRPFLEATEKTLSVAMYDFNADYIAKTFIETISGRGVKAVLTWDDSMTTPETAIRARLKVALKEGLDGWIVKCGANYRFASAYHEKVAVRDSSAFWLSSGNWSLRSQPDIDPIANPTAAKGMYSKGNREWHVIVEDAQLSAVFERYIAHDRDGSKEEAEAGEDEAVLDRRPQERMPDLFVPIETVIGGFDLAASIADPVAPALLPTSARAFEVQPVLTPDNYLKRLVELIGSAQRSLYLQFAYINYSEAAKDEPFREMLKLLADISYRSGFDLRIILGSNGATDKIRKLAEIGFNDKVFRTQGNVHNKGIIVDGTTVLISSTNWSGDGVLRNRDAGVIIYDAEVAGFYRDVFLSDWNDRSNAFLAEDQPILIATPGAETPAGMVRVSWRDYFG
ncbi:phospholipase D-like domain-containing protein [Sinorhizobium fredii]|uniref:phospholipase D-like domain-containing protein n=1 Tax=Rhizobium fredii TaxID=380 RepID=UPI001F372916|nr:phospholipase D-like domain-containing protein [Sinorhizobium fredii]